MSLRRLFSCIVTCSLFMFGSARGDLIHFDPDGNGSDGTYDVFSFDFLQGNSLSEDVFLGGVGHEWTLYYQSTLANISNSVGNAITGTGLTSNYEITAVAGITVKTTSLAGNTIIFERAASPATNFLRLYYDSALNANPLAGTGYNDGTLILDSTAESDLAGFFTFTSNNAGALDQFISDDWPGVITRGGIGALSLTASVTYANTDFFTDGALVDLLFANSSEIIPFRETDPSQQFWDGSSFVSTNVGAHNGISGPDLIVQADANANFTVVPEASSMLLAGMGVAALFLARRKRS